MSRGKRSDFKMIEREGILKVRNENQAKTGKISNKKRKGRRKAKWRGKW